MPTASELIAHGRTEEEIGREIGADRMIYQDLDDLVDAVYHDKTSVTGFDTSCFSGSYVTGDVTEHYLSRLEKERNDAAKMARDSTPEAGQDPDAAAAG